MGSLPIGVVPAVRAMNGALCGRGDMSMASFAGPGEDEGMGGVVVFSVHTLIDTLPSTIGALTTIDAFGELKG